MVCGIIKLSQVRVDIVVDVECVVCVEMSGLIWVCSVVRVWHKVKVLILANKKYTSSHLTWSWETSAECGVVAAILRSLPVWYADYRYHVT